MSVTSPPTACPRSASTFFNESSDVINVQVAKHVSIGKGSSRSLEKTLALVVHFPSFPPNQRALELGSVVAKGVLWHRLDKRRALLEWRIQPYRFTPRRELNDVINIAGTSAWGRPVSRLRARFLLTSVQTLPCDLYDDVTSLQCDLYDDVIRLEGRARGLITCRISLHSRYEESCLQNAMTSSI